MNCIYACNRNSPHHSFFLSLFALSLLWFFAVTGWASKACRRTFITINTRLQLHPVGHGHNHSTDIDGVRRKGVRGKVKGKWTSRSHCRRQWTREYVLVFLYLFISGFPCSFLCLHGSLSKADAEKARARTAHTSHTTCLSLPFSPLSFCYCATACGNSSIMKLCVQQQQSLEKLLLAATEVAPRVAPALLEHVMKTGNDWLYS